MNLPYTGRKSVETAYSPECLWEESASFVVKKIELHAPESNTSVLYIGDRNVCARADYEKGWYLSPGKTETFNLIETEKHLDPRYEN